MPAECPIVIDLAPGPDNPRNSEGAFVTLADGRILFAYTRYHGDSTSDHAPAVIAARYSADDGRTWDAADRVLVAREGSLNVMSVSLLRLLDGRIALFYLRKNTMGDCHPYVRFSGDETETWSDPVCCVPAPGYFVLNNDRVVQLPSGRILVPVAFHRTRQLCPEMATGALWDSRAIALVYFSDDAGETWQEAPDWWALPVRSRSGMQEPGLVALDRRRLYAWARTSVGRQWEMRSSDAGLTWTPPKPSRFQSPCSPLSIKRLATGDLLAVWNDHSSRWPRPETDDGSWGRTPLATAISRDNGKSWRHTRLLEDDPLRGFCYIAIHPLPDAALLAYCSGGRGSSILAATTVRRVSHDWLYER